MTEQEYIDMMMAYQEKREKIESDIEKLEKQYAEEYCPYKIGDIVKCKGYLHTGKQCRIIEKNSTFLSEGSLQPAKFEWHVKVIILKNDGTDSKHITEWSKNTEKYFWENHQR